MQFHQDAPVVTADGKEIGHLDRVVLDPKTKEVTHMIVHKGAFLAHDKVLPVESIGSAQRERITLKHGVDDVEQMPEFREAEYMPLDQEIDKDELGGVPGRYAAAAPLYWYPPAGVPLHAFPVPYVKLTKENIPKNTIPLKEGARVVTRDGHDVGEIEEIITDGTAHRATHILVKKGILNKEHACLPTTWIQSVDEDEVRLAVGTRIVEQAKSLGEVARAAAEGKR